VPAAKEKAADEEEQEDTSYSCGPYTAATTSTESGAAAKSCVQSNAREGRVISVGSFTKILAPGLRLGWLEAAPALVDRISQRGYIISGGGVAPFASEIVSELLLLPHEGNGESDAKLAGGQKAVLEELRADYSLCCTALCTALRQAGCFEFSEPRGGFFVWVKLPAGVRASALLPLAERSHSVLFLPGVVCAPNAPPEDYERYVRLCFALLEPPALVEGVRRLKAAVSEILAAEPTPG